MVKHIAFTLYPVQDMAVVLDPEGNALCLHQRRSPA